jgi:hypothetical protein
MRAKFLPAGTMFKMFNEPLSKGKEAADQGISGLKQQGSAR